MKATLLCFLLLLNGLVLLQAARSPDSVVAKPELPPITALEVQPASLKLEDGRDSRRVLVWGRTADGRRIDVTSEAAFATESDCVALDGEKFINPRKVGKAEVKVSAAGKSAVLPVEVANTEIPNIRFVRDVVPVMSKVGCNAGTCHGSAKGKNGFKLSLRGYDPEFDYQALITDIAGRRFNRVNVDESLMLQKPTAEVPHEGGMILKPDSREYRILRDWIAQGTAYEDASAGRAQRIEVLPAEIDLALPGMVQHVLVLAHYPDGSVRDVTRDAVISSSSDEVATVTGSVVTGVRRGEAAVLVRYEGNYSTQELRVMGDRSGYQWVDVPEYNYVDQHVHAKLRKMKILPSELCTDAEFIRRVSLDLTGLPPTADRVRAFLSDSTDSREKRSKLVDELIGSPEYVEFWVNKWADLLQSSSENLGSKAVWQYRSWIRDAVAKNKPYDQFVREILLAEGSSYQNPAANYYRVLREPGKIAEDVSQTFLGVRFNCNKCHDHPFERWTQNQYYEFAAYFGHVAFKRGPVGTSVVKYEGGGTQHVYNEEVLYRNRDAKVEHPRNGKVISARVPFGRAEGGSDEDIRKEFVAWLTSKENPLFAKAMANRVWSYFFGIGIINPVDDIRASNPPSNAALLDALTEEFVSSKLNLRQIMRTICNSRVYQLSFVPNQWNQDDRLNFSHAQPRRLTAEQLYDAVNFVTGAPRQFSGLPKGMRAVQVADGKVPGDDFLSLFGRPKRQSACECERTSNLTLSHAMSLINGATIGEAVSAPENRIRKLVDGEADDKKIVEELYYAILNRPPSEKENALADFSAAPSRLEGAQDLAWALLNSPAFLFNR